MVPDCRRREHPVQRQGDVGAQRQSRDGPYRNNNMITVSQSYWPSQMGINRVYSTLLDILRVEYEER
jgi:hypothetical protein